MVKSALCSVVLARPPLARVLILVYHGLGVEMRCMIGILLCSKNVGILTMRYQSYKWFKYIPNNRERIVGDSRYNPSLW